MRPVQNNTGRILFRKEIDQDLRLMLQPNEWVILGLISLPLTNASIALFT